MYKFYFVGRIPDEFLIFCPTQWNQKWFRWFSITLSLSKHGKEASRNSQKAKVQKSWKHKHRNFQLSVRGRNKNKLHCTTTEYKEKILDSIYTHRFKETHHYTIQKCQKVSIKIKVISLSTLMKFRNYDNGRQEYPRFFQKIKLYYVVNK